MWMRKRGNELPGFRLMSRSRVPALRSELAKRAWGFPRFRERGAALITVLLFVVLMFILITAMLTVTGNEVVIASLQRDGIRATELAQAGIQEAIARVKNGRPYSSGFCSALSPTPACQSGTPNGVYVTVTRVFPGMNSAYLQIDAIATGIGRATRHLTALVLQEVNAFPPNVTFAASVTEQGSASISCGDAYSQTFLQYSAYPVRPAQPPCKESPFSYSGYRVSKTQGDTVPPCYTHAGCVLAKAIADPTDSRNPPTNSDVNDWYPSTRVTTPAASSLGRDILGFQADADPTHPTCKPNNPIYKGNLPSGAVLQDDSIAPSNMPIYGYDIDTPPLPTGPSSAPTLAVGANDTSSSAPNGTYSVIVTWWTPSGESYGSPASAPITVTSHDINVSNIPLGPGGTTARGIYASKNGGLPYLLVGIIPNNTSTTFPATIKTDKAYWTTPLPTSNVSQLDPDLFSCGLPYEWVPMDYPDLTDEHGSILPGGDVAGRRWFKTIVFQQWFQNYWFFCASASADPLNICYQQDMTVVKRGNGQGTQQCNTDEANWTPFLPDPDSRICVNANVGDPAPSVQPDLIQYPQFGAVPPFPDMSSVTSNYDCTKSGSGVLNSLPTACTKLDGTPTTMDLGYCSNTSTTPPCPPPDSRSVAFELNGDWTINGNLTGYGTIVVNGNLIVNGTFTYYGTIIVNGTVQAGTGNVNVYGGLVAQDTLKLIGNITVNGGTTVGAAGIPTGTSLVFGKAWYER